MQMLQDLEVPDVTSSAQSLYIDSKKCHLSLKGKDISYKGP